MLRNSAATNACFRGGTSSIFRWFTCWCSARSITFTRCMHIDSGMRPMMTILRTIALGSLLVAQPMQTRADIMVMPGDVIQGHAKFEDLCEKCHKKFDKAAQATLCADCHKEI